MSISLVARKDFEDVVRSRTLWSIIVVFVVLSVIIVFGASPEGEWTEILHIFNNLAAQLLIPITALVFGYLAIAGERESGSLRIMFGLSHDRRDVVFGKFISRLSVTIIAAVVLCLVTFGTILVEFGTPDVGTFLAFSGLTILLAAAFTGIAIGVSLVTGRRATAMTGAIGSYLFLLLFWHPLVAGVHYLVEGSLPGYEASNWYFFLLGLEPLTAYRNATGLLTGEFYWPIIGWPNIVEDIPEEQLDVLLLTDRLGSELPFYLSEWFSVLVLLAWAILPVVIGYWYFSRTDLN